MKIVECKTVDKIVANHSVLTQLYPVERFPHMELAQYRRLVPEMQRQGYRQVGVFLEDGTCVAVAGFNVAIRLYLGWILRVNDIVVDEAYRGQGVGRMLLDWLEVEAKRQETAALVLDSTLPKTDNHAFYEHMGFEEYARHFVKPLCG